MKIVDTQSQQNFKKNLGVFFSNNTSLEEWNENGFLNREVHYYKELAKKNINITFFTYGDRKDLKYKKNIFPIKIVPLYSKFYFPNVTILKSILNLFFPIIYKKEIKKLNIIKSNQVWGSLVPCIIKFFFKTPFYIRSGWEPSFRSKDFGIPKIKIFLVFINSLICYNYTDFILVSSKKLNQFIKKKFKINKKISTLGNFIDLKLFKPKKMKRLKNQILMISRITNQKNIELLIDALSKSNIILVHIGSVTPLKKKYILELAKSKKTKIKFLGKKKNEKLPYYYNKSGAYVICSRVEGNPKSLLEAMACKCPIVGTKVEGIKDLIIDNKNGLLCLENAKSLKSSILKILKNKNLSERLSHHALNYVKKNNSFSNYLNFEFKTIMKYAK